MNDPANTTEAPPIKKRRPYVTPVLETESVSEETSAKAAILTEVVIYAGPSS